MDTYFEATMDFPVCNHTQYVNEDNLGYVQGIMSNGVPFEAELWLTNGILNLSVIMPDNIKSDKNKENVLNNGNDFANIMIMFERDDELLAATELIFRDFPRIKKHFLSKWSNSK